MGTKFVIKLKAIHDQTGLTPYAIAKRTGLSQATVRKYVDVDQVTSDYLHIAIFTLAEFYGVDWQEIVEVQNGEEDSPEGLTPQPANSLTGGNGYQAVGGTLVPQRDIAP